MYSNIVVYANFIKRSIIHIGNQAITSIVDNGSFSQPTVSIMGLLATVAVLGTALWRFVESLPA